MKVLCDVSQLHYFEKNVATSLEEEHMDPLKRKCCKILSNMLNFATFMRPVSVQVQWGRSLLKPVCLVATEKWANWVCDIIKDYLFFNLASCFGVYFTYHFD